MDKPSWQQRALAQQEEDEAALAEFARQAELRQQWQTDPLRGDDMYDPGPLGPLDDDWADGRAGLPNAMRGEVLYYGIMFALGLIGFALFLFRGCAPPH